MQRLPASKGMGSLDRMSECELGMSSIDSSNISSSVRNNPRNRNVGSSAIDHSRFMK